MGEVILPQPPARVASLVPVIARVAAWFCGEKPADPGHLNRAALAAILDEHLTWPGGAVVVPVNLRRRFVDACYSAKATRDQATQRARFVVAEWARLSRQKPPPWAALAIAAGPGATVRVKPGTRSVAEVNQAKAAKQQANERAARIEDQARRKGEYARMADAALAGGGA